MSDIPAPMEFKILASPDGYQIERCRGNSTIGTKRCKTYWGAKFYIWSYKRRLHKVGQA